MNPLDLIDSSSVWYVNSVKTLGPLFPCLQNESNLFKCIIPTPKILYVGPWLNIDSAGPQLKQKRSAIYLQYFISAFKHFHCYWSPVPLVTPVFLHGDHCSIYHSPDVLNYPVLQTYLSSDTSALVQIWVQMCKRLIC